MLLKFSGQSERAESRTNTMSTKIEKPGRQGVRRTLQQLHEEEEGEHMAPTGTVCAGHFHLLHISTQHRSCFSFYSLSYSTTDILISILFPLIYKTNAIHREENRNIKDGQNLAAFCSIINKEEVM